MIRSTLTCLALLMVLSPALAQEEYSYEHYDVAEGLAGSTVYCITQDKDGFIWTGTEAGVSRFDGTHFRSFTTRDGLPDIEILQIFGDSRGRVWMAPFRKSVCYYYHGKIYNPENDSTLRLMHFRENIQHFAEDAAGNILIQEVAALHLLSKDGRCVEIDSISERPITKCTAVSRSIDGHFLVQMNDSVYKFDGSHMKALVHLNLDYAGDRNPNFMSLSPGAVIWRCNLTTGSILSLETGRRGTVPFSYIDFRHVSYSIVADSLFYVNEAWGTTEYRLGSAKTRTFLPGVEVSRVFRDDEGNTWFTTIGHGIYRLNSAEIRNISLKRQRYGNCSVHSIRKLKDELLVGTNRNSVFRFKLPGMESLGYHQLSSLEKKRIISIDTLDRGRILYGTDMTLEIRTAKKRDSLVYMGITVKAAYLKNVHQVFFATYNGAFVMNIDNFGSLDTLCKGRTTTLFYNNDTVYVGTMDGLYRVIDKPGGKRPTEFMGANIPILARRIASMVKSRQGVLWIAPYDDLGIVGIKDGKIVRTIGRQQGLTSDVCKTLAMDRDFLWVGTDKGLNKVDLRSPNARIMQYTAGDGLGSNVINTICVDSPMVYVGTPAGLSFFDETKVFSSDYCRLTWLDISSSGQSLLRDTSHLGLSYRQNNIRFEFVGISYKSAGNILYRYRLLGLDTAWKTTKEAFLDYPTLPSGDYEVQITAVNKFGTVSRPLALRFSVSTPLWRTVWFDSAFVLCLLFLIWLFVSIRIRRIRSVEKEKERISHRMMELEHAALQAQMNPHFIFNCLNSIQQYIFNQDVFLANKYISGFSKLIRTTLQSSNKAFISLSDEVGYLSGYLALEKLRFKEKMDYSIEVDPGLDDNAFIIPPMLIQPYVENCMRHGLRHKSDGKGYIYIKFEKLDTRLVVTVEDNGIGRKMAATFKTREHIEYQSRGMALTEDRIRMMNTKYNGSIITRVFDLENVSGQPSGTRVIIEFPLFHILSDNNDI